jgi:hypothetical protein
MFDALPQEGFLILTPLIVVGKCQKEYWGFVCVETS